MQLGCALLDVHAFEAPQAIIRTSGATRSGYHLWTRRRNAMRLRCASIFHYGRWSVGRRPAPSASCRSAAEVRDRRCPQRRAHPRRASAGPGGAAPPSCGSGRVRRGRMTSVAEAGRGAPSHRLQPHRVRVGAAGVVLQRELAAQQVSRSAALLVLRRLHGGEGFGGGVGERTRCPPEPAAASASKAPGGSTARRCAGWPPCQGRGSAEAGRSACRSRRRAPSGVSNLHPRPFLSRKRMKAISASAPKRARLLACNLPSAACGRIAR